MPNGRDVKTVLHIVKLLQLLQIVIIFMRVLIAVYGGNLTMEIVGFKRIKDSQILIR